MGKKILLSVLAFLAAIALVGWLGHFFSDQELIRRRLVECAMEIGKEGEETPLEWGLKMKVVQALLAPDCRVRIPEREYDQELARDLLIPYLISYRDRHDNLRVEIEGLDLRVEKERAEVQAKVEISGSLAQETERFAEVHELVFDFRKGEGKWVVHGAILPQGLVDGPRHTANP